MMTKDSALTHQSPNKHTRMRKCYCSSSDQSELMVIALHGFKPMASQTTYHLLTHVRA
jgi:hypothetical protein